MSTKRIIRKISKNASENSCGKCKKAFKSKRALGMHNYKNPNCDNGYNCDKCSKSFRSNHDLERHLNRINPCVPEEVPVISGNNEDNTCKYCGKKYATKGNLTRHMKICDVDASAKAIIAKLSAQLEDAESRAIQNTTQNITNITNNNTVNVQNNINVMIVGYGSEDLTRLNMGKIKRLIMEKAQEFIPQMIEQIHNNDELPEYKNILYDVQKNCAVVLTNKGKDELTWVLKDPTVVSQELTNKIKSHVINNQELNGMFGTAADDKDWEQFAKGIHVINDMDGESLQDENMLALAEAGDSNDPDVQGLITAN